MGEDPSLSLLIKEYPDGQVHYLLPAPPGAKITVHLLHSYDRLPYWELYQVREDGKFIFSKIGGKSLLNGQGFAFPGYRHLPDGTWEIGEINEIKENICFFMGTKGDADHKVTVGETTFALSERVSPGRLVCLSLTEGEDKYDGK